MAKNDARVTDNPKLKQKKLSDGNISLYLDYYLGRVNCKDECGNTVNKVQRKREFLHLTILANPRTPIERKQNKETLELAQTIRFEREQELKQTLHGYRIKKDRDINFLDYFQAYIDKYDKKDKRMVRIALNRFKDFLQDTPEYNRYIHTIKPEFIDRDMIVTFTEYLQSRSYGEGAKSIYQRFKKVLKYAVDHDVILKNPCDGVQIRVDENTLKKDILSQEEIQTLMSTHLKGQNMEVRRAFILCLYCGLRYCDVKDLTFANVDYSNKLMKFEQNKTKGHSLNSGVIIPLNDGILNLIGKPQKGQDKNSLIFNLPTYEMCLKSLKRWVRAAGIDKHISWHCARHSFAVNILNNGANIKTVASLLGHSGLKHTEKYTRAIDSLKQEAINSLPTLNIEDI